MCSGIVYFLTSKYRSWVKQGGVNRQLQQQCFTVSLMFKMCLAGYVIIYRTDSSGTLYWQSIK